MSKFVDNEASYINLRNSLLINYYVVNGMLIFIKLLVKTKSTY